MTIKASMKAQATAFTVMPMIPFIQNTPGFTFDRPDSRLGRIALKYDAMDTVRVRKYVRAVEETSASRLTNNVRACKGIKCRQIADVDAVQYRQ